MTKKEQQPIYVSPEVETIELKAQAIICGNERENALNGTEMFEGDDNWFFIIPKRKPKSNFQRQKGTVL